MSDTHAFLIMAHRDQWMLERLLRCLDDPRNDIFLHVDKDSQCIDVNSISGVLTKARILVVESSKISWGGFDMVEVELKLLRAASTKRHAYYHLLSGADLPLVGQDELHNFFAEHEGREYVHLNDADWHRRNSFRVTRRHLLARRGGARGATPRDVILRQADRVAGKAQTLLKWDPVSAGGATPYGGSQWFSVTHDLVHYILAQERWIRRTLGRGLLVDEWFMQTVVMNSPHRDRLYIRDLDADHRGALRKVDWKRGYPYVWRSDDIDELLSAGRAGYIFARKFDSSIDRLVIGELCRRACGQ